ncbi:MAG: hypothetical protein HDS37_03320 [Bacteroides sp.]|nr:hypothetical protein [Bacteroides sp.]
MLLIHSYAENYVNNYEHWTTSERWEKICSGMEWSKNEYDIDFVVPSYCVYGPTGILIGVNMSEEQWMQLPGGFYIRNGRRCLRDTDGDGVWADLTDDFPYFVD